MQSLSKLSHSASVPNTGAPAALPHDALFEVLLRLPAKELCRLRVVCRAWRALTSDLHFAAEHKSRHAEPLFTFTFRDADGATRGVAIVGLSGQPLRRIPFASAPIELLQTDLDRLCVYRWCKPSLGAWVLNPGTGVAFALPGLDSDEFVGICIEQKSGLRWNSSFAHNCRTVTYAFGQVASTREYKVLRISHPNGSTVLICDIITVDGSSQGMWRRKQNSPSSLMRTRGEITEYLAVNGVVYFLLDYAVMEPASTAPFNLDTEEWMPTLRGPEPLRSAKFRTFVREISLTNLNGSLVIIDNDADVSFDLWFLMDHNTGLWVKKYRLSDLWFLMDHNTGLWVKKYRLSVAQECLYARPLLILDDGKIVIYDIKERQLQCYDPTTDSLTDVLDIKEMGLGETQSFGVYTGSLLI